MTVSTRPFAHENKPSIVNCINVSNGCSTVGSQSDIQDTTVVQFTDGISGTAKASRERFGTLLLTDVLVVAGASLLSGLLYSIVLNMSDSQFQLQQAVRGVNGVVMLFLPLLLVVASHFHGHYSRFKPFWSEMREFVLIAGLTISTGAFALFATNAHFSRIWFVFFWLIVLACIPLVRLAARRRLHRRGLWMRPTLIVGEGKNAVSTQEAIEHDFYIGQRVVGVISTKNLSPVAFASAVSEFERLYGKLNVVYAPGDSTSFNELNELLSGCLARAETVIVSPPASGLAFYGTTPVNVLTHDAILLEVNTNLRRKSNLIVKRAFDIAISLVAIVVLSPLLLILTLVVALDGGSPFYKSRRIGQSGVEFDALKFRSMVVNGKKVLNEYFSTNPEAQEQWRSQYKLDHDPRITSIGRFLRRSSLDELPQLLNVLRGEMSLVGPRPILPDEVVSYDLGFDLYCQLPPGMTGLWQVSGRNDLSHKRRVELNIWYAKNWSLWIDMVLILKTLPTVLLGSGAR